MHAVANDKYDNGLREPPAERRFDELPAENTSAELFVLPAELKETFEHRAEIS